MEILNIRRAFEKAIQVLSSVTLEIAYENVKYEPKSDVAFMALQLSPRPVENPTIGDAYYREVGEFQIFLCYPAHKGSAPAFTKAQEIRDSFERGMTLVEGGTEVIIQRTPRINGAMVSEDRYVVPVIIEYFASVLNT
jgi:hypothetical protein